jgi:type IV pilus assembly protein PilF
MLHRKRFKKLLVVSSLCVLLGACTSSGSMGDFVSDSDKAKTNLQLGVRYLELNMLETAKEKLNKAVALDSDNAEIHNALGALHERLGQHEVAGEHYKESISLDEENESIQNNYGRFLCTSGDYKAGMALLNKSLDVSFNAKKWFAHTNLGLCELGLNNKVVAEENFRQALKINVSYPPALLEMQKMSYHARKYMSARAFLERYLGVAKHTAETLWYAAQTERSLGNEEMAEHYRTQLLKDFSASKEAQQVKTAIR